RLASSGERTAMVGSTAREDATDRRRTQSGALRRSVLRGRGRATRACSADRGVPLGIAVVDIPVVDGAVMHVRVVHEPRRLGVAGRLPRLGADLDPHVTIGAPRSGA